MIAISKMSRIWTCKIDQDRFTAQNVFEQFRAMLYMSEVNSKKVEHTVKLHVKHGNQYIFVGEYNLTLDTDFVGIVKTMKRVCGIQSQGE